RQLLNEYRRGKISVEEYEIEESLEKNRICNTTTVSSWLAFFFFSFPLVHLPQTISYLGYTITLCLTLALLLPLKDNPMVNNYVLVLSGRDCFKKLPLVVDLCSGQGQLI